MSPGAQCCLVANGKLRLRDVKRLVSITQQTSFMWTHTKVRIPVSGNTEILLDVFVASFFQRPRGHPRL